jgi:hypothetical protein
VDLWPADRCRFIASRQLAYVNSDAACLCVGSITPDIMQSDRRHCKGDLFVHRLFYKASSSLRSNVMGEYLAFILCMREFWLSDLSYPALKSVAAHSSETLVSAYKSPRR